MSEMTERPQAVEAAGAAPASESSVREARERLDARVREVVAFHFDPETGCDFWLERAKELGWDPRREVRGFDDLARFGTLRDEDLHGGPVERFVPRGLSGQPIYVFETAASGLSRVRISAGGYREDIALFSETLPEERFPRGSDWISLGPTGPRRTRVAMEHLAHVRQGICFLLDMDPRWVARCLERGRTDAAQAYQDHVVDQALTILRAHPNIRCLFTTPKLLEALCEKVSLNQVGITGVVCGGTHVTPDFHRLAREELVGDAAFVPTYGSALMGFAGHKPFVPEDELVVTYHAPEPRAALQVVDPERPEQVVGYGERGRVKLTTLTEECFLPAVLEPDEATRTRPIALYPWDGIADVRALSRGRRKVVEGVY